MKSAINELGNKIPASEVIWVSHLFPSFWCLAAESTRLDAAGAGSAPPWARQPGDWEPGDTRAAGSEGRRGVSPAGKSCSYSAPQGNKGPMLAGPQLWRQKVLRCHRACFLQSALSSVTLGMTTFSQHFEVFPGLAHPCCLLPSSPPPEPPPGRDHSDADSVTPQRPVSECREVRDTQRPGLWMGTVGTVSLQGRIGCLPCLRSTSSILRTTFF